MNRSFGAQGLFAGDLFFPGFVQAYEEPHDVPRRAPMTQDAPDSSYSEARPKNVRASSFTGPLGFTYSEARSKNLKRDQMSFL